MPDPSPPNVQLTLCGVRILLNHPSSGHWCAISGRPPHWDERGRGSFGNENHKQNQSQYQNQSITLSHPVGTLSGANPRDVFQSCLTENSVSQALEGIMGKCSANNCLEKTAQFRVHLKSRFLTQPRCRARASHLGELLCGLARVVEPDLVLAEADPRPRLGRVGGGGPGLR